MAQQNALDAFMQFYSPPAKTPTKSVLRHSSYNISISDEITNAENNSPSLLQHAASSPSPPSSLSSTPSSLKVSINLDNMSSPRGASPRSSPYDTGSVNLTTNLKKSNSTPQIPSSVRFGKESSDSTLSSASSFSARSDIDSPGIERSNSYDFAQEVIIHDVEEDDETEDSTSFSSELEDDSPLGTSNGSSPPSSVSGTVRRKSTSIRYFPTSEASLEKFFRPPEGGEPIVVDEKEGAVKFKKATEEDYSKMAKNPEGYSSSKLAKLHRRHSRMQSKGDEFNPSQDTLAKSSVLKQIFYEKHSLMTGDPRKYQHELLSARGELRLPSDLKKKMKKLNFNFVTIREKIPIRDRSKSSPPVPSQVARSLSLTEILIRDGSPIPRLVRQALDFLSTEEALNTEGLFRVAGNSYEIDILWESLADGESIPSNCEVHTVTSVFKRFFRELKEPLFTYKLHKKFLHAVNDDLTEDETIQKLKETLNECPEANKKIIRELFDFLRKVMDHSDLNMMHAINLGIVFGPSLLRDESSMGAMFDNRNQVVATILDNYNAIFDVKPGDTAP